MTRLNAIVCSSLPAVWEIHVECLGTNATNPQCGKLCFTCRKEASDKELTAVLLADSKLLQLPLEALSFLQVNNVHCVAREFSLQMFYHRIAKFLLKESGKLH